MLNVDRPVGIGPVIAGWDGGQPVYYVDLAFRDGSVKRLTWPKAAAGADRKAKMDAVCARIGLAKEARPGVVLAHDRDSFAGLVALLPAPATPPAARAAR